MRIGEKWSGRGPSRVTARGAGRPEQAGKVVELPLGCLLRQPKHSWDAVADADSAVRECLELWLAELGYEVVAVDGGRPLVELCRPTPPDLVISEVRMPDGDGLTTAEVIRRELSIPIILVSGGWTCEKRERAAAIGTTCLEKPLRPLGLVAAIAAATRAAPGDDPLRQAGLKKQVDALQVRVNSLRELDEKRTAFLATLAHELRNPLCPLLNYANILTQKANSPDIRAVGEKIDRQVRHLGQLVEDLMDVARVCQGKTRLDRRRVDAREVVGQAVDTVKPRSRPPAIG